MWNPFRREPPPQSEDRCPVVQKVDGNLAECGQCTVRLFKTVRDEWKPARLGICPFGC